MKRVFGAQFDLVSQIKRHVFILCPNNSGSTFLSKALGLSDKVWSLHREGQHVQGFVGPSTGRNRYALIWSASPQWRNLFLDTSAYDWEITRKAWYFQATASHSSASVFSVRTPPFLLIPDQLVENFEHTCFIIMVRNPYVAIEGIVRNTGVKSARKAVLEHAARHIMSCFEFQKRNVDAYRDRATSFTYEQMCDDPELVEHKLVDLMPEVSDISLKQKIGVKGNYNEPLRNMNDQQMARLSKDDFEVINPILEAHEGLMAHFGYALKSKG